MKKKIILAAFAIGIVICSIGYAAGEGQKCFTISEACCDANQLCYPAHYVTEAGVSDVICCENYNEFSNGRVWKASIPE